MVDVPTRTLLDYLNSLPSGGVGGAVTRDLTIRDDLATGQQAVPPGGSTGEVLTKLGDGDFDTGWATAGQGTVQTITVDTANGFAGASDGDPSNPTLTLSTTVTGLLKGDGTEISAAVDGTDFQGPITLTTTGSSGAATFDGETLNIPEYPGGDMMASVYDPQSIEADAFDRANHTGTQGADTITGLADVATSGSYDDLTDKPTLGDAAGKNVGTTPGTVAAGDDPRFLWNTWGLLRPQTRALLNYWQANGVEEPKSGRTFLIDATIDRLVDAGLWAKVELLYVLAAHDDAAALINWKSPGNYTASVQGVVAFHTDEGFEGDGNTGSYIDTNWAPGTNATIISQNDGHMAVWSLTPDQSSALIGHTQIAINPRSTSDTFSTRANSGTTHNTSGITSGAGFFSWVRRDSANIEKYVDGVSVETSANTSAAYTGGTLRMCGSNIGGGQYSTRRQAFQSVGSQMSDDEMAIYYAIIADYMAAVEAI